MIPEEAPMLKSHKLPLNFDPDRLKADLAVIQPDEWVPHFNTSYYEGEAWYLDLNLRHRVDNHSDTDRIHLVIDCVVNDWVRALFETKEDELWISPTSPTR